MCMCIQNITIRKSIPECQDFMYHTVDTFTSITHFPPHFHFTLHVFFGPDCAALSHSVPRPRPGNHTPAYNEWAHPFQPGNRPVDFTLGALIRPGHGGEGRGGGGAAIWRDQLQGFAAIPLTWRADNWTMQWGGSGRKAGPYGSDRWDLSAPAMLCSAPSEMERFDT